jgi:hypothetical protein
MAAKHTAPSPKIVPPTYRQRPDVSGIITIALPAKMVEGEAVRDRAAQNFEGKPMDMDKLAGRAAVLSADISVLAGLAEPTASWRISSVFVGWLGHVISLLNLNLGLLAVRFVDPLVDLVERPKEQAQAQKQGNDNDDEIEPVTVPWKERVPLHGPSGSGFVRQRIGDDADQHSD